MNKNKTLEEIKKEFNEKYRPYIYDWNEDEIDELWLWIESTILQTKQNKDYVVVESQEVANDLIKNYKGKSLQRKWVVVAPKGIKEVSIDELLKLPQIKEIVSQNKQELIEDKNARDNRIHKEGFDAGYKKGYKVGYMEGWLNGIKKH